jgi:cytosine/adenosine deaminase-related metal-dependent hydrolase
MAAGKIASTGRALFEGALQGGSRALGVAIAGIAEGAPADLVSLDAGHVALAGRSGDAILDGWIFGGSNSVVDCVWTRGRKVVTGGRHRDSEIVAARYRRTLEGLLAA